MNSHLIEASLKKPLQIKQSKLFSLAYLTYFTSYKFKVTQSMVNFYFILCKLWVVKLQVWSIAGKWNRVYSCTFELLFMLNLFKKMFDHPLSLWSDKKWSIVCSAKLLHTQVERDISQQSWTWRQILPCSWQGLIQYSSHIVITSFICVQPSHNKSIND